MSVTGEIKNLYSDKDKTRVLLPRTKTKAVSDENGVGLDALLDGKAPAGYGLGEGNVNDLTTLVELDAIKVNSFRNYYGEALPVKRASSSNHSQGGVLTIHGHKFVTQYFFLRYPNRGCVLKRYTDTDGEIWGEWEWVNPPMELGVEYRTTERWLGMPVYCKAVNVEAFPTNGSSASVYYLDYSPRAVLRFVAHSSYILYPNRVYGKHIDVMDNKIYMESTGEPYDGGGVHVAVWYVKN